MDSVFLHKKPNFEKLKDFGFEKINNNYLFETELDEIQMRLCVSVAENGEVGTKVFDISSGDEYTLYKVPSAVGAFVGQVREEVSGVLLRISEDCFEEEIFKTDGAKAVIAYIKEKYGDEFEYLWEKFPDNAVVRRKDNKKWYAALLTVKNEKLGLESGEILEILDIRADSEDIRLLTDNEKIYPGYHMNKKHWITVILNGTVSDREVFELIDKSYVSAKKR